MSIKLLYLEPSISESAGHTHVALCIGESAYFFGLSFRNQMILVLSIPACINKNKNSENLSLD